MSNSQRAAGLILSTLTLTVLPATTPTAHAACIDMGYHYYLSAVDTRIPFSKVPTFKDGPGGTLTVSNSYSGTATYQVTAGTSAEVSTILAKAQVQISASLTTSNTTSYTHTYSHPITSGRYGHAQYVSWGKSVSWKKEYVSATCAVSTVGTGTIKYPSSSEGYYYWETTS